MAITRGKKEAILKKASDIVNESESVVFVNFHGLGVEDTNKLRNLLRENGVSYFVLKKTLVKKVLNESKTLGDIPQLDGELALASSSDSIAPARSIYEFSKEHGETISILGGIFEGSYMNKDEMMEIASIPTLEVLYGKFVNVISSPVRGLVVALDQISKSKEITN